MNEPQATSRGRAIDPEAWVDRHGDGLYRYALLRVRDPDLAADLVQETFLHALRNRETFAGRASERTWLVSILRRKVVDQIRRKSRSRPVQEVEREETILGRFFDERGFWKVRPARWGVRPDQEMERVEFWATFQGCLAQLPPTLADAFLLRELEGLSGDEVCDAIRITPANLWARLHRARLLLRQCLERRWFGRR
jgi:RNA polymerase sigma-70 factor (ECF subfamily)